MREPSAAQALQKLVGKDKVKCLAAKRDMYQRVLGVCFDERTNVDLNQEMVKQGEAIAVRSRFGPIPLAC